MARSPKRRRGRASSVGAAEVERAYSTAVRAIAAFWDAAIAVQIKTKSKRHPNADRIAMVRAALGATIIGQLMADLRCIGELRFRKPYRQWSRAQRLEAAVFIEKVYSRLAKGVGRRPGRPSKRPTERGIINSKMEEGEAARRLLLKQWLRDVKKPELIEAVRLGSWAAKETESYVRGGNNRPSAERQAAARARLGTLQAARRYVSEAAVDLAEIEASMSVAEAIRRLVPESRSDRKLAKRLEMAVSRSKRSPRR